MAANNTWSKTQWASKLCPPKTTSLVEKREVLDYTTGKMKTVKVTLDEPTQKIYDTMKPRFEKYYNTMFEQERNLLFHGFAGSGKSFEMRLFIHYLQEERRKNVGCTASTGSAAVFYEEVGQSGCTLHRWMGVGLAADSADKLYKRIKSARDKQLLRRLETTDVLAIDEISMISLDFFNKIDYILRKVRVKDTPMGGMRILACGDFLQLSPVKEDWAFKSAAWKQCNFYPVIFNHPHRFESDPEYADMLLRCRKGYLLEKDVALLKDQSRTSPDILNGVIIPTKLYPVNRLVEVENIKKLQELETESRIYTCFDSFFSTKEEDNKRMAIARASGERIRQEKKEQEDKEANKEAGDQQQPQPITQYPSKGRGIPDHYEKMLSSAIPAQIELKVGAQVMVKKNIDVSRGLINGTRGVVLSMTASSVEIQLVNGNKATIEHTWWTVGTKKEEAIRIQMPLVLAWAVSIHKAQGLTLDAADGDVGSNIFAEGQAYIALSRVRNRASLRLLAFDPKVVSCSQQALKYVESIEGNPETKEQEYQEPPRKVAKMAENSNVHS